MKLTVFWLLIFLLETQASTAYAQNLYSTGSIRIVDFRLLYPVVSLRSYQEGSETIDVRSKGKNGLGLAITYNIFITEFLGINMEPTMWFLPAKIGGSREYLGGAFFHSGLSLRPFRKNYLDPTLLVQGGIGLMDAGDRVAAKMTVPVGSILSLTLYNENSRFEDSSLSLCLQGGGYYFFNRLKLVGPTIYQAGLALRGSF